MLTQAENELLCREGLTFKGTTAVMHGYRRNVGEIVVPRQARDDTNGSALVLVMASVGPAA
jgi:hypothetical protein